ncbi:VCBS repeat-containing protein [Candidatus Poribacteria bacterium]|nr:VCBS repeat-containing protein [Candidatus Poribacteria bacterium]
MTRSLPHAFALGLLLVPGGMRAAQLQTGATPQHVVVSDLNRDSRADLIVANAFDDTLAVFLQDTSGGFTPSQTLTAGSNPAPNSNFPRFLLEADVNQDGAPDVIALCSGNFFFGSPPSVQTFVNDGSGALRPLAAEPVLPSINSDQFPIQFVCGQFTSDSNRDLAVAALRGDAIHVLAGDGTGRFTFSMSFAAETGGDGPQDLAAADLDGDGREDLAVVTSSGFLLVRQTAPGVFAAPAAAELPVSGTDLRAVSLDDFNGDGAMDAALADGTGRVILLSALSSSGSSQDATVLADPSLAECSDVLSIAWDGDWIPDIAVTNLAGNSVTIFGSAGSVYTLPTGAEPRRLAAGDLNGDGRLDLATANEGDEGAPGNPDADLVENSITLQTDATGTLDGEQPLGGTLGLRLAGAQGLTVSNPTKVWILENQRGAIQELNPSPALNANLSARIGDRLTWPFEAGGIHFNKPTEGYVAERNAATVHKFKSSAGIQGAIALAQGPGVLGFGGMTWDDDLEQFYLSDPANGQALRFSKTGALLGQIASDAWDMVWEDDLERLFSVTPGRSDVRVCDQAGIPDTTLGFDLATTYTIFSGTGNLGIAKVLNKTELYVLNSTGLLVHTDYAGRALDVVSIAPATQTIAIACDPTSNTLYTLGRDAHIAAFEKDTMTGGRLISVWPAIEADPSFVPGGLAFDPAVPELLVSDASRPLVALISPDGTFNGFRTYSPGRAAPLLVGGIAVDPIRGGVFFRGQYSVWNGLTGETLPAPASTTPDLAARDGLILCGAANPGEALILRLDAPDQPVAVPLPNADPGGGFAFDGDGALVHFGELDVSPVETFLLTIPDPAGLDWRLY